MSKSVIQISNLSKRYRLGLKEKQANTLVGQITQAVKSPWENLRRLRELNRFGADYESVFWALKDVSFEVKEGEVLGIIGKNGAGKSTLLKILSQITEPTSGKIEIHGRVASLLEVGTGFHPELSGRENIYMNGTILGMTRKEIDSKLDEIIDFSGVEKFIDTPVKFYSSGMKVRLGFSVAAHLNPEILIVDEVLSVGDYEFQAKCLSKMEEVSKGQGRTVLFVSHNLGAVSSLCSKSLVLKEGLVSYIGHTNSALKDYLYLSSNENFDAIDGNDNLKVIVFELFSSEQITRNLPHNEDWDIYIKLDSEIEIKKTIISLVLFSSESERISTIHIKPYNIKIGLNEIRVKVIGGVLVPKSYYFNLHIHDEYEDFLLIENIYSFSIFDNGSEFYKWQGQDIGKLFLKYEV